MLPKSAKQKGKRLEKYVASELRKIFKFAYSRADSGSGKEHKEDITLPDDIPLFIECKNHAKPEINTWFRDIEEKCPENKYPILIFKQNYQKPKAVIRVSDFLNFLSGSKTDWKIFFFIEFDFKDFINLLKVKYDNY